MGSVSKYISNHRHCSGYAALPLINSTGRPANWTCTLALSGSRESTRNENDGSELANSLITAKPWAPVPPITSMSLDMVVQFYGFRVCVR